MKLSLGRILLALTVFEKIEAQQLPFVSAYWYNTQLEKLVPFREKYINSAKLLQEKHRKDDGAINYDEYNKDMEELLAEEHEIIIDQRPAKYFSTVSLTREDSMWISFLFNSEN